jgi:hypothetical protein
MATENLLRLSLKLLGTGLAEDGCFVVSHEGYQVTVLQLPADLRAAVKELVEEVAAIVPNDFAFSVSFTVRGASLSVDFEDGNTGSTAFNGLFTSRKSLLKKLRGLDWDGTRAELIEQGGIFEKLVSEAADRPANIHSSREAAARHAHELEKILGELADAPRTGPFVMVVARDDLGIEVDDYPSRQAVVDEMGDVMTTGYEILAVVEGKTPWTFDAIEAAKLEAVERLGPISRAKAERRFGL